MSSSSLITPAICIFSGSVNFIFVERNSGGCFSLKVLVHCESKLTSVGVGYSVQ